MISIKKVWQFDSREEVTRRRKIVAKMGDKRQTRNFQGNVSLRFFQSIVSRLNAPTRLLARTERSREKRELAESKYCRGVQVTRTPARVKAAKRLHAGQATRAHVTLGSFSTHGFARAAITIITGLWLCERATGAQPGLRLFCEIDLTYSLAYANRQCYASEMRASLPSPSPASFRHWNRFNRGHIFSLSLSLCFSSMSAARGHTSFLFPWNPISEFLLEKKKSNNNNSTLHLDCFFW